MMVSDADGVGVLWAMARTQIRMQSDSRYEDGWAKRLQRPSRVLNCASALVRRDGGAFPAPSLPSHTATR